MKTTHVYYDVTFLRYPIPAAGVHRYAIELLKAMKKSPQAEVSYGFSGYNHNARLLDRWSAQVHRRWPDVFDRKLAHRRLIRHFNTDKLSHALEILGRDRWDKQLHSKLSKKADELGFSVATPDLRHNLFGVSAFAAAGYVNRDGLPEFLTVHDVLPMTHPRFFRKSEVRVFSKVMRTLKTHPEITLVCVSRSTFHELVKLGIRPERCHVVPHGVSDFFSPAPIGPLNQTLRKRRLKRGKYILSVATLEPRKNLVALLGAFRLLKRKSEWRDWTLVLTGAGGWHRIEPKIRRLAKSYGVDVRLTGHVDDAELRALYSGAGVFAYVPHAEGFGLPPLEAMGCGVPVVVSDGDALTESVGDAALRVPSSDEEAISRAISRAAFDERTRKSLRERGFKRAGTMTWERTAKRTFDVYRRVLASR